MKIGILLEHFDPARGGLETYADLFARHLATQGHAVSIFAQDAHGIPATADFRCIPANASKLDIARVREESGVEVLIGLGKHAGADLVIPQGGTYVGTIRQNNALMRPAALGTAARWLNPINPTYRKHAKREREIYNQHPHVVAVSKIVRDDLRQYYRIPDDRLHLIYNGCDIQAFTPQRCAAVRDSARRSWDIDAKTTCFLIVARNPLLKGLRELIEAAGRLKKLDPNFIVLVVGQGISSRFRRQAEHLAVADRFRFLGSIPEILPAYGAADAYVHPTWYDPCSLSVMEAWACARPVITTRFNGASELMTDGCEGFVIDTPADVVSLAGSMAKLLDPAARQSMHAAARELAERNSLQANFTAVLQLADQIKQG